VTIADSLFENFGGLKLPISSENVTENLTPLDPARSVLANLFASAINSELGSVWTKITDTLPKGNELKGTKPVQQILELPPNSSTLGQIKEEWPVLAVHRAGEGTYDEYTLFNQRLTQTWNIHYILGPVGIVEERKLGDICVAVAKIVRMVIELGGHSSYENGAVQFFDDKAALAYIALKSQEGPGQAQFVGKDENSPLYYAITLVLESWEITSANLDGYADLQGVGLTVGVGSSEGTIPLIYADTEGQNN